MGKHWMEHGEPDVAPQVFELHNADLVSEGASHVVRDRDGRLQYATGHGPLPGEEHRIGAFDNYDLRGINVESEMARAKEGYMDAAMQRPMAADACADYAWGYRNYRAADGERFGAEAIADVQRISGELRAAGVLPDRRLNPHVPAGRYSGWAVAGYALLALVAGLALPEIVARVSALWGSL